MNGKVEPVRSIKIGYEYGSVEEIEDEPAREDLRSYEEPGKESE